MLRREARKLFEAGIAVDTAAGRIYTAMTDDEHSRGVHITVGTLAKQLKLSKSVVHYGLRLLRGAGLIERIPRESYKRLGLRRTYAGTVYLLPLRDPERTKPRASVVVSDPFLDPDTGRTTWRQST